MKRVVLNTTSSCLEGFAAPHNIEFIRFKIYVNNVDFIDGKNINADRLGNLMMMNPAAPSASRTTPATVEEIIEVFQSLENQGYTDVFIVSISSAISQSYANFVRAQGLFAGKLNIYVYDTKAATIMEGALAFEADQLIKQGKSFDDIVERLDQIRQNSYGYITVSQLDYLIANKKISSPAGFFANLLEIKPVIEVAQSGELIPIKKIRKIENSVEYLAQSCYELSNKGAFVYMLVGGDEGLNQYFSSLLAQKYGITNLPKLKTATITLANHGPNMVGFGAFTGEKPALTKYL